MNLDTKSIGVGILAGFASAVLLMSAGQPSFLSVFLFAASALPIFIAGFGWSNQASITAVIFGFAGFAIFVGIQSAIVNTVIALAPAAWIAHLSTLARPASEMGGPNDQLVWYPLPQILLHASTMMVLTTVFIGWMIGYGPELSGQLVDAFTGILSQQGNNSLEPQNILATKALLAMLIPMIQSAMWVVIIFSAWYFAGHIVRMSGRAKRPRDTIHIHLRMPKIGILFLFAGLLLIFLGGSIAYIGAAMVGGFGAAFMLSGLAVFHHKTVGRAWRGVAIWAVYASILLFTLPVLIFVIVGLFATDKHAPLLVSQINQKLSN